MGMMPFLDPAGKAFSPESGFGGEVGEMDEESLDGGNGIAPGIGTGAEVHIEAGFVRVWGSGLQLLRESDAPSVPNEVSLPMKPE